MSDSKISETKTHPVKMIDGILVQVTEITWDNGGKSFDVDEVTVDQETQEVLDNEELTIAESFDTYPTDDEIRSVLPEKATWHYTVTVTNATRLQAERVMSERISYSEDLGFDYGIESSEPFEHVG